MESILYINNLIETETFLDDYDVRNLITSIVNNLNDIEKTTENKLLISRIVSRYIGLEDIEFEDYQLEKLLDFIDWHYPTIMEYSDDWTDSERECSYGFSKLLKFATKMNKKITGLSDYVSIRDMFVAVVYDDDEFVEDYVINNNIKIPHNIFEEDDALLDHIKDWVSKQN